MRRGQSSDPPCCCCCCCCCRCCVAAATAAASAGVQRVNTSKFRHTHRSGDGEIPGCGDCLPGVILRTGGGSRDERGNRRTEAASIHRSRIGRRAHRSRSSSSTRASRTARFSLDEWVPLPEPKYVKATATAAQRHTGDTAYTSRGRGIRRSRGRGREILIFFVCGKAPKNRTEPSHGWTTSVCC